MNKLKEENGMTNTIIAKANKMVEMIKERGINAEIQMKNTNGVESIGICMGSGTVRPLIYPNFDSEKSLDEMVDSIIKTYNQVKNTEGISADIIQSFNDFDVAKQSIIPCVMAKVTDDIVSRDYLDLKVMYRYITADKQASIAIKKSHIDKWGVTEEELFNIAKENVRPTFINMSMMQMLAKMKGSAEIELPDVADDPLRVFTTQSLNWGASALLFPELFEFMGNNIIILPSSVHEVLAITGNANMDSDELAEMITGINQTTVQPEEVLSNHPYVCSDGKIREVA